MLTPFGIVQVHQSGAGELVPKMCRYEFSGELIPYKAKVWVRAMQRTGFWLGFCGEQEA